MTKSAVHIGAGSIGRGFLGQLYFESGFHTTFIDVVDEIVHALNERGSYPVDIVSESGVKRVVVGQVSAVHGKDSNAAAHALAKADIVSTAVGLNALPHVAPLIAQGIIERFTNNNEAAPLDILLCENVNDGEQYMRSLMQEYLAPQYHDWLHERVGIVEASIGRMVPVMTPEQRAEDPLLVCVEPYCDLPVDAAGFKGPVPNITHLNPTENFAAYVERKLFVHNLTHAATAYLGYLSGYHYIYEAIRDDHIRTVVDAAGRESCVALTKKHGLDAAELDAHRADLIRRYHNRRLADQIARVARDPLRKLAPGDRLSGAATCCTEQGVAPEHIAIAVAAAMMYDDGDDPAVDALRELLQQGGPRAVLTEVCELNPDAEPGSLILQAYQRLSHNQGI